MVPCGPSRVNRPQDTGRDFVASPANAVALAQIGGWRDWPGGKLALAGPEGSGKSHLAHIWAAEAGGVILTPDDLRDPVEDELETDALIPDPEDALEERDDTHYTDRENET